MKTLLICHEGARLDRYGMSRWLSSFSELVGIIVLRETKKRMRKRIRREIERVGYIRFIDIVAFRLYYTLFIARNDERWERIELAELCRRYPDPPEHTPVLRTQSPNTKEAEAFIRERKPDLMIARCKTLLKKEIYSIPSKGTLVLHPGICPEYRNAHGCFWALANNDLTHVGMTLLRIDDGVDTGAIYGYYTYPFDETRESHIIIQHRVVYENLEALKITMLKIYHAEAIPLETAGRPSAAWGQPWLTQYLKWKRNAKKRIR